MSTGPGGPCLPCGPCWPLQALRPGRQLARLEILGEQRMVLDLRGVDRAVLELPGADAVRREDETARRVADGRGAQEGDREGGDGQDRWKPLLHRTLLFCLGAYFSSSASACALVSLGGVRPPRQPAGDCGPQFSTTSFQTTFLSCTTRTPRPVSG